MYDISVILWTINISRWGGVSWSGSSNRPLLQSTNFRYLIARVRLNTINTKHRIKIHPPIFFILSIHFFGLLQLCNNIFFSTKSFIFTFSSLNNCCSITTGGENYGRGVTAYLYVSGHLKKKPRKFFKMQVHITFMWCINSC